ncbi:helix-turn-helix domain-containing protein [Saccharopolyspora indica]|uniref:helix-turn-helix domain-containing protein n=1 Tax=Saccharopolyspora indica TaxID=1229659 RepID=UPI0022EA5908|nr:helix-turn-helix domain-containing protein [Saccharopolyspora indica]MDA3644339.1 helix-turn-helix domain-containing protein [Saccharopolyspora indica]
MSDDEREAIAVLLAGTDTINAIARQTGRNRNTVRRILERDPELQRLRAAALRTRNLQILDELINGVPPVRIAALHGVGTHVVSTVAAPIRDQITTARSTRPWTGEDLAQLLVFRPRIDTVMARFTTGRATVREVIAAVTAAESALLEELLRASLGEPDALPPKRQAIRFTQEERLLLVRLREVDKLTWPQIARRFPRRHPHVLQVRYHTDRTRRTFDADRLPAPDTQQPAITHQSAPHHAPDQERTF